MKVTIQTRNNQHGINGVPVEIKQIIDEQAVIVLPSGKKTFVDVASIQKFNGEIEFSPDTSYATLTPDPEVHAPAVPQSAPLFDGVMEIESGVEIEDEVPTEEPQKKTRK